MIKFISGFVLGAVSLYLFYALCASLITPMSWYKFINYYPAAFAMNIVWHDYLKLPYTPEVERWWKVGREN